MKCKIFFGRNREELENKVNQWLENHPVTPDSMHFQFSTVSVDDDVMLIMDHTLILFYVPMHEVR